MLTGCSCGCVPIGPEYNPPEGYEITSSYLSVFADGCAQSNGRVDNLGMPLGSCDAAGQYVNRGRWVKAPNIQTVANNRISIGINGSIFYCSTGYDNKEPTPNFIVKPSEPVNTLFADGSELALSPGEIVVLEVVEGSTDAGVFIGSSTPNTTTCTNYNSLVSGQCSAKQGLGLSIYVGEQEIVTLDNTYNKNSYYPLAQIRNPFLFAYVNPNDRSSHTSFPNISMTDSSGQGKYLFMVPDGIQGKLGFAIARGVGSVGKGQYTLKIRSTPGACFVDRAQAEGNVGYRGAMQVLISTANPNDIDNVLNLWNSLSNNNITSYYSSLRNYINSQSGIKIGKNQKVLTDLIIPSAPNLSPLIITEPSYSSFTDVSGDLWFKVKDDYYHDNVGQYDVSVSVVTRKNSVVSKFLMNLIKPIYSLLETSTQNMYNSFSYQKFTNIIRLCLLLYIIIYGASFALGLIGIEASDIIIRIFKLAVVIQLLDSNSWDFFNRYFFKLFTDGSASLTAYVTGDYSQNKENTFSFIDDIFQIFFSPNTWTKLVSLFPSLIGVIFMFLLIFIMAFYLVTLARVFIAYLISLVMMSVLISVAPIFIVLLLFERTKKHFDNWIKYLADYALQPIIMLVTLFILNIIFLAVWNNAMNYELCFGDIVKFKLPLSYWTKGFLKDVSLGCIKFLKVKFTMGYLGMFASILQLLTVALAMSTLVSSVPAITSSITGATAAAGNVAKTADTLVHQGVTAVQSSARKSTISAVASISSRFRR